MSAADVTTTPGIPVITSVSPIRPTGEQTIIIRGSGFGRQDPFNGCSNSIKVTNVATNRFAGWGPPTGGCLDTVRVYVKSWTDDKTVLGGFPGYPGPLGGWLFHVGDVVLVEVANAQGDGITNKDPNLKGGPVAKFSVSVTEQ